MTPQLCDVLSSPFTRRRFPACVRRGRSPYGARQADPRPLPPSGSRLEELLARCRRASRPPTRLVRRKDRRARKGADQDASAQEFARRPDRVAWSAVDRGANLTDLAVNPVGADLSSPGRWDLHGSGVPGAGSRSNGGSRRLPVYEELRAKACRHSVPWGGALRMMVRPWARAGDGTSSMLDDLTSPVRASTCRQPLAGNRMDRRRRPTRPASRPRSAPAEVPGIRPDAFGSARAPTIKSRSCCARTASATCRGILCCFNGETGRPRAARRSSLLLVVAFADGHCLIDIAEGLLQRLPASRVREAVIAVRRCRDRRAGSGRAGVGCALITPPIADLPGSSGSPRTERQPARP